MHQNLNTSGEGTCGCNVLELKENQGIGYVSLKCQWSNLQHQYTILLSVKYLVISHLNASTWSMELGLISVGGTGVWKLCILSAKCVGEESREWSHIVYHCVTIFTFLTNYRIQHLHVECCVSLESKFVFLVTDASLTQTLLYLFMLSIHGWVNELLIPAFEKATLEMSLQNTIYGPSLDPLNMPYDLNVLKQIKIRSFH